MLCQLSYVPFDRSRVADPPASRAWQSMGENHQRPSLRAAPSASRNRSGGGPGPGGHRLGRRSGATLTMGAMSDTASSSPRTRRVSGRIGAIAESATLAVDAKAKALKAAGPPGDRLRRRRARLPDPRLHRRGGRRGLPRPQEPPLHPGRRPARAQGGDRRQDAARQRATTCRRPRSLVTNGGKQAIYEAFATMLDPGDEVIAPRAVLDDLPRVDPARRRRRRSTVLADETQGYLVTVEQLEAARTERTKVLLFVSPSNPTGAVYTAERDPRRSAAGPWSTACGCSPTRSTSTWSTAASRPARCPCCARAGRQRASSSTAWPRPTR